MKDSIRGSLAAGAASSPTPVGWVLIAVGAVLSIIGWVLSWFASDNEVSDLEVWVSRSCLGKGLPTSDAELAPYTSLEEEIEGLRSVLYVIKLDLEWHDNLGRDQLEIKLELFGYDKAKSDFCLAVLFKSKDATYQKYILKLKTSALSADNDLKPGNVLNNTNGAKPGVTLKKPGVTRPGGAPKNLPTPASMPVSINNVPSTEEAEEGVLRYHVTIDFNEDAYRVVAADVKLEYRPDKSQPDWVVTFGKTDGNTTSIED